MMSLEVILLLCAFTVHSTTSQPVLEANASNLGIIGGHNVSIEDAPFMARLLSYKPITGEKRFSIILCGSSIIHEQFVLTAAHCCKGYTRQIIKIGSADVFEGAKIYTAANMSSHKLYDIRSNDYDICLIKLNDTLTFGPTIGKIDLADDRVQLDDGAELNALGWGQTEINNPESRSRYLLEVTVPYIAKCQEQTDYLITSRMICAGATNRTANLGDSGGPLTLNNKIQVGIASLAPEFDESKWIAGYTKIAPLLPWIHSTMKEL